MRFAAGTSLILFGLGLILGSLFFPDLPLAWLGMVMLAAGVVLVAMGVLVGRAWRRARGRWG